ncbi:MAG: nucleoside-diphosphate sugar epimerase/dehydratase [Bacilli bacterium]|jgi:FlaA1/EpsC-like NDP-sugar epimerase
MKYMFTKKNVLSTLGFVLVDILIVGGVYALFILASYRNIVVLDSIQLTVAILTGVALILFVELTFVFSGVYGIIVTNFGILEAIKVMGITFIDVLLFYLVVYLIPDNFLPHIKPEVYFLGLLVIVFLVPAMRYVKRVTRFVLTTLSKKGKTVRTLVIGAGSAAKIVIDEARNNPRSHNDIVAVIDDDRNKIGGSFSNIPVKGPISRIGEIIDYMEVEEVIIAIANISSQRLKEIIKALDACNVRVKRLPLLSEMQGARAINIFDVDMDELLGREPVKLDNKELSKMFDGATILVTGAGGSIGSELVNQIYDAKPARLVLFDIYENGVYDVQQKLLMKARKVFNKTEVEVLIGSTYNEQRMEQIFKKYKPDYVYHAAAYKHVPLMEESPQEAIRTNVFGTYNVAYLANKYHAKKMILVSTDKAVRSTNVMGATKRFAEMIIQHFSQLTTTTKYAAVRFGNVLGSSGSVIPLFKKQILEGGPITVTDERITRFFMTIDESVSLILQCSIYANKGEIFILDMGEPVKIISLAEKMIRQSGHMPYKEIDIKITGLRPGEKLYEEILIDVEKHKKTENKKIYIEDCTTDFDIDKDISNISQVFDLESNQEVKELLSSIVTTYSCKIKPE